MSQSLRPRDVARLTGVSTDTLRHYERRKLLPSPARTAAGYRRYSEDTVDRVLLIQRALIVGFSLEDLGRVLKERDKGGAPCRQVRGLVGERLVDLDRHIRELQALRRDLKTLMAEWDGTLAVTPAGRPAHLLETLGGRAPIETARLRRKGDAAIRTPAAETAGPVARRDSPASGRSPQWPARPARLRSRSPRR